MDFLDRVRAKRQKLADVLYDEDYSGIRDIVEELYPDRAHFIYELLQNAEDTGATEATFHLSATSLSFTHNGRPFGEDDVWAISNIGKGTKRDQEDKIGRFGVGFKAVFAYCETPHIWSPTFSFKISELVLPMAIGRFPQLGDRTRFEFPFNNPNKPAQDAYSEINAGLLELSETTLLFLKHLRSIWWQIDGAESGGVNRVSHSENHIEVRKHVGQRILSRAHFLRFAEAVESLTQQTVSVAFALDYLPGISAFETKRPLAKQLKIVPAIPGRVAVFFPAEKETSGLRFHLHAPFVPELSRASVKDTPANSPLYSQLALLSARSLHSIRDLNLLTPEFLGVLPNDQDSLPDRYSPIRDAIIAEMDSAPLTPTHRKSHAPGSRLLQARALLKDLLSAEDLKLLIDYDDDPPEWAVGATQRNSNVDRFLSSLSIQEWDVAQFVDCLRAKLTNNLYQKPAADVMKWLKNKSLEWHQRAYAVLGSEIATGPDYRRRQSAERLKTVQLVRLSSGDYATGPTAFFPGPGVTNGVHPRVAKGVFSFGKNKQQQGDARKFLFDIGVREVGELEEVEAILKQRYRAEAIEPEIEDLERFVSLVEKDRRHAQLFSSYYILQRSDDKWAMPSQVFLDQPYSDIGIGAYFKHLGQKSNKEALADCYAEGPVTRDRLLAFLDAVGVQSQLEISKVSCRNNPAYWDIVHASPGGWSTSYGINSDFTIEGLTEFLKGRELSRSKLIWRTMCESRNDHILVARYRNNSQYATQTAPSQLVCSLKALAWVPQKNGTFVVPAQALRTQLPKGFPFDEAYAWLKAIDFGEEERQRSDDHRQKQEVAQALGFGTEECLARAKRFAAMPVDEQVRLLAEFQQRQLTELPVREPSNPELRAERISRGAAVAPERVVEKRLRSISVGMEDVKVEAEQYLRQQYSNEDGVMICQVCKAPLPFKLDDDSYYFEKVELLPELEKRHYQNYLALCPNHSAMFQFANGSQSILLDAIEEMEGHELVVVLAKEEHTIYFTQTHISDLWAVIRTERQSCKAAAK